MSHIVADSDLREKLQSLRQQAEVRDAAGRLIGFFTPISPEEEDAYRRASAEIDPEEMRRRKESGAVGLTFDEVLKSLPQLTGS